MLIRLLFHVYLIIIALYVVILVEECIIHFAGLLEQEEVWRAAWINLRLAKVWTILISESCLCLLAEPFASTFQPQYVDFLLNPIHRKLSFTTELATPLGRALSVWGFSIFLTFFCIGFRSLLPLRNTFLVLLLQLILPHMVDHTFMALPIPLQTL